MNLGARGTVVSCGSRRAACSYRQALALGEANGELRSRGSACERTYFFRMPIKVLNLEPSLGFSSVMAGGFSAFVVMLGGVKFEFRYIEVASHR